jgi:hypothetical protein
MATYLQTVNNVLKRLRERTVATVDETPYSSLIGVLVNDAKREVEDSHNWSGLRVTLSTDTTANVFNYELNGSGNRITILDILNDTDNVVMQQQPSSWMNEKFLLTDQVTGSPRYYAFNGLSLDDDSQIDIYPIPDKAYTIRVNCVLRTVEMTADTDSLYVPAPPVQLLAYAKAVEERGEDGGASATAAYASAVRAWNDAIALDAAKHSEEIWKTV